MNIVLQGSPKIDVKFDANIVGSSSSAAPDWNAAEGQSGHIKNRTHYGRDIILSSNESDGKHTYFLDYYESDDLAAAWLSFYDITESRTREISLSDLNGFVLDLGYAQINFFLMYDSNEGAYYVAVESSTGNVDSRILDSVAIQTVAKTINQGYIPDSIARFSYIEELYEEVTALWEAIEMPRRSTTWFGVSEVDIMNNLDTNLTEERMAQMGFGEILANPYDIKGIIIEGDGRNIALALSSVHMQNDEFSCITFGNNSRMDTGAELTLNRNYDNTWVITYIEA